jgi:hypothetical protein
MQRNRNTLIEGEIRPCALTAFSTFVFRMYKKIHYGNRIIIKR